GGADVLDADRVLRPADRVAEGRRALAAGVVAEGLGHHPELLAGDAAHLLDELGRVAGVVAAQELEHAARVLERRVLFGRLAVLERTTVASVAGRLALVRAHLALAGGAVHGHPGVLPGAVVVGALAVLPAREEAVELLGVLEALVDDDG